MPRFVHLAPEKLAARIRRSGIRAPRVFCFPVLPSYTLTYQWGRELRRCGQRPFVAVTFTLPADEPVLVGHFGSTPAPVTAATAVGILRALDDPRGHEVIVPRPVLAGEIAYVRAAKPGIGWRYAPGQNGVKPCGCPACLGSGAFKSRAMRDAYEDFTPTPYDEVFARLRSDDPAAVVDGLFALGKRGDPVRDLAFLAGHPDPDVREILSETIADYPVRARNRWIRAGFPIDVAADESD